jgi:proline dehydrogenase
MKEGYQPEKETHDANLLVEIFRFIQQKKINPNSFYFEMLYGIRRDIQKIIKVKVILGNNIYPYGRAWPSISYADCRKTTCDL